MLAELPLSLRSMVCRTMTLIHVLYALEITRQFPLGNNLVYRRCTNGLIAAILRSHDYFVSAMRIET